MSFVVFSGVTKGRSWRESEGRAFFGLILCILLAHHPIHNMSGNLGSPTHILTINHVLGDAEPCLWSPKHLLYITKTGQWISLSTTTQKQSLTCAFSPRKHSLLSPEDIGAWCATNEDLLLGQRPQVLGKSFWHSSELANFFPFSRI